MENTCKYKLKAKYNGLPLAFGSQVYVTNNNITDEYAEKLLERYEADVIFDKYPVKKELKKEAVQEIENETLSEPQKPVKRNKKRRK